MAPTFDPKRQSGPMRAVFRLLVPGRFKQLRADGNVTIENIPRGSDLVELTLHDPDSFDTTGLEYVGDKLPDTVH
jgi:hypothetical protein